MGLRLGVDFGVASTPPRPRAEAVGRARRKEKGEEEKQAWGFA
jgi:hypothetical protein